MEVCLKPVSDDLGHRKQLLLHESFGPVDQDHGQAIVLLEVILNVFHGR